MNRSGLAIEAIRAKIVSYHRAEPEHCELAHRGQIDTCAHPFRRNSRDGRIAQYSLDFVAQDCFAFMMRSPHDILAGLWKLTDGEPAALDSVKLTGEEPVLPSSFRVAAAAQVPIAASALAAAEIWKLRGGEAQ